MSVLSSLKLVAGKPERAVSPVMIRRNKLCAKLNEQIAACAAQLEGETYVRKALKVVVDEATGERRAVNVNKRVREWYWQTDSGKYLLTIKYGAKTLMLGKGGKNAIELTTQNDVVDALKLIKNAVSAGELDDVIAETVTATRKGFGK